MQVGTRNSSMDVSSIGVSNIYSRSSVLPHWPSSFNPSSIALSSCGLLLMLVIVVKRKQQNTGLSQNTCSTFAFPPSAAASPPSTPSLNPANNNAASYNYFDLDAWQQSDQFKLASTVRRSNRLCNRGSTTTPSATTGKVKNENSGVGADMGADGEAQEESVCVRRSRGTFMGMQAVSGIPQQQQQQQLDGVDEPEDQDWSPEGGRILRLRWEPSAGGQSYSEFQPLFHPTVTMIIYEEGADRGPFPGCFSLHNFCIIVANPVRKFCVKGQEVVGPPCQYGLTFGRDLLCGPINIRAQFPLKILYHMVYVSSIAFQL